MNIRNNLPLAVMLCVGQTLMCLSAANVGIVDAGAEGRGALDILAETIKGLGHQAEKISTAEFPRPTGLSHYDCIIVAYRSGELLESEYRVLDEYSREGGTLLFTGMAGYWMKMPDDAPVRRRRIAGAGPLDEFVGARLTGFREMPITLMRVVVKDPAVMGLPESFTLQTTPPYNPDNPGSWRRAGALPVKAEPAMVLIKADVLDTDGNKVEIDFLTVNRHGRGKSYRWALYDIVPMIFEKKEKNMALILQNILKESEIRM